MPFLTVIKAVNFQPKLVVAGGTPDVASRSQLELGLQFYNGLSRSVTVVTRAGLRYTIPPDRQARHRTFVVRRLNTVQDHVDIDTRDLSSDEGPTTSEEAEALSKVHYRKDTRLGGWGQTVATVDYVLDTNDFVSNGGVLYLPTFDLVLSAVTRQGEVVHPFSLVGVRKQAIENHTLLNTGTGFEYVIEMVDNAGHWGVRYVNIAGTVYTVPVVQDPSRRDGVYVTSSVPSQGGSRVVCPQSVYYAFEDAENELKLYRTIAEARTLGNPDDERDRFLKEEAHQLKLEEHRLKNDKLQREADWEREKDRIRHDHFTREEALKAQEQKFKQEELEYQKDLQRLKQDELRVKQDEMRLKQEELRLKHLDLELKAKLDRQAHRRKRTIETLKAIPPVITGLIAAYGAIKALKK